MNLALPSLVLSQLHSDDLDTRLQALMDLDEAQLDSLQVGDFEPLLSDEDHAVRQLTLSALAEIGDIAAIPLILEATADHDPRVVAAATAALREFRTREAIDPFTAGVAHHAPEVRAAAIVNLRDFRSQRAIPALRAALEDASAQVRREAVVTLAQIADARTTELLLWSFYDQDPAVRQAAVRAVGGVGDDKTLGLVIRALQDVDGEVRRVAASMLVAYPGASAAQFALRRALRDAHPEVVREAIRSLGKLQAPVAEYLAPFLENESREIRIAAAKALGQIGEASSRFALAALLHDSDKGVIRAALHAIAQLDAFESKAA